MAALMQGLMLGAFIDGIPVKDGKFAGDVFSFFSPFALVSGFGVIAGYGLLGATWLIFRTAGSTQGFARMAARWFLLATLAFIGIVSLWTPLTHPAIAERWFSLPNILFLWPVPFVTLALAVLIWRAIPVAPDGRPFSYAVTLALLAYAGLGTSLWPYAIPNSVTIWQAAASSDTLIFTGIGTAIILPLTLAYLGYAHWVFRGKVEGG
jgi:cytochrome d ubiquinol oxidase subunit II